MRLSALSLAHTPLADHSVGCVCATLCLAHKSMQQHSLMVTSPSGLCSILSMPLGPREERSVRATVFAARMFALTASVPRSRDLLPCSCTAKICMERCCCRCPNLASRFRSVWPPLGALILDQRIVFLQEEPGEAQKRTLMMMKGLPYSSNARDILAAACFKFACCSAQGQREGGAGARAKRDVLTKHLCG